MAKKAKKEIPPPGMSETVGGRSLAPLQWRLGCAMREAIGFVRWIHLGKIEEELGKHKFVTATCGGSNVWVRYRRLRFSYVRVLDSTESISRVLGKSGREEWQTFEQGRGPSGLGIGWA